MTTLTWSPQSLRDLDAIRAYIGADSPAYADLIVRRILAAVERLERFPQSGRMVPEMNSPDLREVIAASYRVVYRRSPGRVEIVTVFRASRLFPNVPV